MSTSTPVAPALNGWASIADAATALGISRDTVRRMISRGEARAERVGPRLIRVDLSSIQRQPVGPRVGPDYEAVRERLLAQLPVEMIDPNVLTQLDRLINEAKRSNAHANLRRDRAVDERIAAGDDE
ncbi:helix-turn-helix domain-containing protein [Microbacterium sp. EYE_5]|uniref:helix-turn-helix domain-containing protein n=1 Tax=unclassified Microbacterium TaxID=2609290 RepID=UPI002002D79A|nr:MULTISPECIES: helix-turn-helix domain-containing protein [unclassified Microbacterium]MCK6080971.1 helix-turn-helix domain-containing protein [Microbacterium sp. EYE_382]MCK6086241.1 helix-turn-helix domain-containing protein [Microbacterium sp. EYE_384]MCK6124261.1 helix-turn-helix domain-containing protein [Microbacterium sp. EYE_80]MCK6127170.1 helix-turn-helix domain-containing protein [Microbacterium sp. EYE_79]MCK6141926.1 helix-turn-helix domain-containing protein [Microbacterium sp.